jgi:beta-xylosidase
MQFKTKLLKPGELWLDTDGNPIQAHGGGILYFENTYYWYGENKAGESWLPECNIEWDGYRVDAIGINCYSSKDLLQWKNEGIVLPSVKDNPQHDLHTSKVIERPKALFNQKTGQFVLWMHIDTIDYQYARVGVAVSDSPTGPFSYLGSMRPDNSDSRDMTVFQDTDGKAYLIYSSAWNSELHISLLTDDYLKLTGQFVKAFVTEVRNHGPESPAVFKHEKNYFMITSHCTGWDPNPAEYAIADSISGPWKAMGNPCVGQGADTTFNSQGTYVFQVAHQHGDYIFMADRWNKKDLKNSRYVWLPIQIQDDRLKIELQVIINNRIGE